MAGAGGEISLLLATNGIYHVQPMMKVALEKQL